MTVLLTSLGIVLARVIDVSLGTLRTIFIIQGRGLVASTLGFLEVLIWILVASQVIRHLDHPLYLVSYAAGFAAGTWVGIRIEAWLAPGRQVLRVFTRRGSSLARDLRERGYTLTEFSGKGMEGPVDLLLLESSRRRLLEVLPFIAERDETAIMLVDDVRVYNTRRPGIVPRPLWSHVPKKK